MGEGKFVPSIKHRVITHKWGLNFMFPMTYSHGKRYLTYPTVVFTRWLREKSYPPKESKPLFKLLATNFTRRYISASI
jgi:hypothetical protein